MRKYKKISCLFTATTLLGVAVFCGMQLYQHNQQINVQEQIFEKIATDLEENTEKIQKEKTLTEAAPVSKGEDVLPQYQELHLANEDMVGWLSIPDTSINYPVMQTVQQPNFYLKRNFEKEYSDLGVPFLQENCDPLTSDNLIIYGHHINGGRMFGTLDNYKSESFYESHRIIHFDTLTEQKEYEVLIVFKTVAYSSEAFRYYDFVKAKDEKEFNDYLSNCKKLSFYDTGVSAQYGNKLLTLSTCEYSAENGRLVVVAKEIT